MSVCVSFSSGVVCGSVVRVLVYAGEGRAEFLLFPCIFGTLPSRTKTHEKKQILRFWGKKVFVFFSKFLSRDIGTISICFFHKCRHLTLPQDDNGTMF